MTPIVKGSCLLEGDGVALCPAVPVHYHIWQHSKSEMLLNKASLAAVPALPWGCGSCSRAEGDTPSKWSMGKTKCCGHSIYYKGWVFPLNNPLANAMEKGVPEDQRKLIEHWHSKSGVDDPSNPGVYWSGIDSGQNKWWTGVGLARECKGGVIETSINCFMGIKWSHKPYLFS